jgi:hypothetical protein
MKLNYYKTDFEAWSNRNKNNGLHRCFWSPSFQLANLSLLVTGGFHTSVLLWLFQVVKSKTHIVNDVAATAFFASLPAMAIQWFVPKGSVMMGFLYGALFYSLWRVLVDYRMMLLSSSPYREPAVCSICLEATCMETKMTLPCEHCFHHTCLMQWRLYQQSCPLCRHEMKTIMIGSMPCSRQSRGIEVT